MATKKYLINEGDMAPDFSILGSDKKKHSLSDYKGKNVILYFYPKDNTPGCTVEANSFKDNNSEISKVNAVVIGVSRDSLSSHDKFIDKFDLPFLLLSDEDEVVVKLYDVLQEKTMFGKKSMGIERTTFIVDKDGKIAKIYRKPKTEDHASLVLNDIKELNL